MFITVALNLAPWIILGLILAVPVFRIARRSGRAAWLWAVLSAIPIIGFGVQLVFYQNVILSLLDRIDLVLPT